MQFLTVTWNVDPELITIGPMHVRYYGALFVCAFVVSYFLFLRMFKREKLPVALLEQLTVIVGISTFVGARLGHCLFYQPGYFLAHPLEIILPVRFSPHFEIIGYQGLASHGAAFGILIGLWYFCRKHKKNYIWILDRIAIAIPLAGCMVRIGNLMNSEIYGDVTNLPWGFIFVRAGETQPHHPTQLYEALSYLALFFLLHYLYRRKLPALRRGTLFGIFLIGLFSARFFIEFIKEPQVGFEENMFLNMGQWLSVPFIVAGVTFLWWSLKYGKPEPAGAQPAKQTKKQLK
ncbi:MAG: prolipoprotein diacylglyceryl transferase [Prevotellaceae bacterium]|jgi:prolipoprotein diacylglyceryl transferase|nr:prolipoprotein diacylglyceryl transferase [Prevotellaceae bacterium]